MAGVKPVTHQHADEIRAIATRTYANHSIAASGIEQGGYLYDVVDARRRRRRRACRPNQVFAISLDHPVLDESRWAAVLNVVTERLLTPVGLRSLAPGSPTTRRNITATCARATPPTIRVRSGPG